MNQIKLFFALMLLPAILGSQNIIIDSCGTNSEPHLNRFEVEYFNAMLHSDFDFENKKVAFFYGNFGKQRITKKEYFEQWGRSYFLRNSEVINQYIFFTEEEKEKSSGYDVVVVSWSKIIISDRRKRKIIRKLSRSKSKLKKNL